MNSNKLMFVLGPLITLVIIVLGGMSVISQEPWYASCPVDPTPAPTFGIQPTLTPRPTLTPLPMPTCRPTKIPQVVETPTPYPTQSPYPTQIPYPTQPPELVVQTVNGRGLWSWLYSWETNQWNIDEIMDRAEQGLLDVVIFYIGYGSANYPSDLLPHMTNVSDFDALAYAVETAHARDLEIEAWWCPGEAPLDQRFRDRYPASWNVSNIAGIPNDAHYLNFSNPEVRQFVADVVEELAGYDVDGVHLDYIRYDPPPPWGLYDPADFFNPTDVPMTVELAYTQLKAMRPDVRLTAAVMSSLASSTGHLQNWDDWLTGDYIDLVMPMAYYDPDETYAKPDGSGTLERDFLIWQTVAHPERVVPGIKTTSKDGTYKTPTQLLTQLDVVGEGWTLFSSKGISSAQLDALADYVP